MDNSAATFFLAGVVGALFALALAWLLRGRREEHIERISDPYAEALRERADLERALHVHRSLIVKSDLTHKERIDIFANVAEDHLALWQPERALRTVEVAMRDLGERHPSLLAAGM